MITKKIAQKQLDKAVHELCAKNYTHINAERLCEIHGKLHSEWISGNYSWKHKRAVPDYVESHSGYGVSGRANIYKIDVSEVRSLRNKLKYDLQYGRIASRVKRDTKFLTQFFTDEELEKSREREAARLAENYEEQMKRCEVVLKYAEAYGEMLPTRRSA